MLKAPYLTMIFMSDVIFIDASALLALANSSDQYHQRAKQSFTVMLEDKSRFITTNFILDEVYTRIKRKAGSLIAINFGELLKNEKNIKIEWIDKENEKIAWTIFKKYSDQRFSYTDCTSFAFMKQMKIKKTFCFDGDFKWMGFECIPSE